MSQREVVVYEMRAEQLEHTEGRVLRWHAVQPATRGAALCGHRLAGAADGAAREYEVAREEYCTPCVTAVREAMRLSAAGGAPTARQQTAGA